MTYINTFIQIAPDSDAARAVIPNNAQRTIHRIQYELLTYHPYQFNHEELIYAVYLERNGIDTPSPDLWTELFSKGHPCLRASALTKKYGWGAHYNHAGKIALYPVDSNEYHHFTHDDTIQLLYAMRSKRA